MFPLKHVPIRHLHVSAEKHAAVFCQNSALGHPVCNLDGYLRILQEIKENIIEHRTRSSGDHVPCPPGAEGKNNKKT